MKKYKVWECKIVVPIETEFPKEINGFDCVPRRAVIESVEKFGIKILSCFSGWNGKLTKIEKQIMDK